jgi:hypothetical protein
MLMLVAFCKRTRHWFAAGDTAYAASLQKETAKGTLTIGTKG